jgi:hypothetical protein
LVLNVRHHLVEHLLEALILSLDHMLQSSFHGQHFGLQEMSWMRLD